MPQGSRKDFPSADQGRNSLQGTLGTLRTTSGVGREQLLLLVEQDGDDDADDEDHGQDGPDDPDEPLLTINDGLGVRVVQLDGVREGTGSIGLEDREQVEQSSEMGWGLQSGQAHDVPQQEQLERR